MEYFPPKGSKSISSSETTYKYKNELLILESYSESGQGEIEYNYNDNGKLESSYNLHGFGSEGISYKYNDEEQLIKKHIFSEVEMGVSESEITYEYNSNDLLEKEIEVRLNYILNYKENANKTIIETKYYYEED